MPTTDYYHPDNMVLVVAGGFEPEEALALVQQHLGSLPAPERTPSLSLDWEQVPAKQRVEWDSTVQAVCLAFPPPPEPGRRFLLSLWGATLMRRLLGDEAIQEVAASVFCSNPQWGVGPLPFFIYATTKPGVGVDQLQRVLETRLQDMVADPLQRGESHQLRMMARQFFQPFPWTSAIIHQQAKAVARQSGQDEGQAVGMVLGNLAVQAGMRELLLNPTSTKRLDSAQTLDEEDWRGLVQQVLDPGRQRVTVLTPARDEPPTTNGGGG